MESSRAEFLAGGIVSRTKGQGVVGGRPKYGTPSSMEYSSFEFKIGGEKGCVIGANVIFTDFPTPCLDLFGDSRFCQALIGGFAGLTISSPILGGKTRRAEPVMDFAGVNCNRRLA